MQHPTKEQVQVVIDNLYKAKEIAHNNCPVNMMQDTIFTEPCGSPMCHGGWYGVASNLKKFLDGAEKMAIDLGFENADQLEEWGRINPKIWGSLHGDQMFWDGSAFGMEGDEGDLQQIIDHWKGVQERLPA